jgi:site-specific DNA recombinase
MRDAPQSTGIYCRLSFSPDGSEEKVDRQETDCRQLGDRLAWPVNDEYVFKDNSRSAWRRDRKRPAWDAMLAAINAGDIDSVIVYHGDRMIRQPWDLEVLIREAEDRGIRIASPHGTRNLDSPDDRFILRIEAAQACKASDDTSRRVRRGLEALASRQMPRPGGRRPFGFERDNHTIRRTEADLVEAAAERLLAGQTIYGVLAWLNEHSTTTSGNRWTSKALQRMLTRPRYAGLLERNGTIIGEAVWDPILDFDTWDDVRRVLADRKNDHGGRDNMIRYLLSGWARCGTCKHPTQVKIGGSRRYRTRSYACVNPDCGQRVRRKVELLDAYITGRVVKTLNNPQFIASLHDTGADDGSSQELTRLERGKQRAEQQLKNLADFPEVDPADLMEGIASYTRKITELKSKRASTARRRLLSKMAGISPEQWAAEPVDVRRSTVQALFLIEILPGEARRGFDPAAVTVTPVSD